MIPKIAVANFLDRELDDHHWMKELSHAAVDEAIAALNPKPKLWPGLFLHQKVCILLGIAYPKFSFWLDMGAGKTIVALELLRYWYNLGRFQKGIIFVKSDKAFPTWERQIREYGINIPTATLEGSSEAKWKTFSTLDKGLVLVTYPGAVAMTSKSVKDKKGKTKWVPDPKLIKRFTKGAGALVLDESTSVGDPSSLAHRLALQVANRTGVHYALAGRPFGRDPLMLWAEQYVVDGGESFGETQGIFREAFYTAKKNPWNEYAKDYTLRDDHQPELIKMIQHRSIAYTANECIDLPDHQPIVEKVNLSVEALAYRAAIVQQLIAAKGNFREIDNAFIRLRQLSSGFLGMKDDETGERVELELIAEPKLDLLLDLIAELPSDRKAVVFYDFTYSGRRITEELKDRGTDSIWLWSGTKDYRSDLAKFCAPAGPQIAVINNKVGAYSLDGLQTVANYCFFYESPVPVIDREQAERRLRRQGQTRKVFQYDLVVRSTADERILDFHREGRDLKKALVDDPSQVFDT